jgi:hypothetical protein
MAFDGDATDLRRLALASPGKVPIEFIGRARDLRRQVFAEDESASALLHKIMVPTQIRLRTHARVRDGTLTDIARRWRAEVPSRFRLSLDVQRDKHHGTTITEQRMCASQMRCEEWEAEYKEQAISILCVELLADKKRTSFQNHVVAAISLHALGRWFQRVREPTEANLIADVRALAAHIMTLHELERRDFTAPVPRGVWTGHLVAVENPSNGQLICICACRTFIDSDSIRGA